MEEESPKRRPRWHPRSLIGAVWPGRYPGDAQIRRYGLVAVLSTGLLGLVGRTMDGMRADLRADRVEERKLRAEERDSLVRGLQELTSAQATQAASVAVLASQTQQAMAVILDRAHVRIQPVRPQVTTIYVQSPIPAPPIQQPQLTAPPPPQSQSQSQPQRPMREQRPLRDRVDR